jgi:hypothetical protein
MMSNWPGGSMLFKINNRRLKVIVTTIVAFNVASAVPEKGQILELQDLINGRGDSKFRTEDKNRIYELPKGTIGQIDEAPVAFRINPITKKASAYGLCIKILNANVSDKKDCYWVYYVESRGNIKILDKSPEEVSSAPDVKPKAVHPDYKPQVQSTEKTEKVMPIHTGNGVVEKLRVDNEAGRSTVVQTTAPILAVRAVAAAKPAKIAAPSVARPVPAQVASAKATDSGNSKPGESVMDRHAAVLASRLSGLNQAINPEAPPEQRYGCDGMCNHTPLFYTDEICTKKNDYLEKDIERLRNTPESIIQKLFQSAEPEKYIKDECFASSLKNIGGIPYKTCDGNKVRSAPRPCASNTLKITTRKAFDLTMDCLGTYYTNGQTSVQSAASNFFFLIAHESGHNPNAVSVTGAGGTTQMTDPINRDTGKPDGAITYINRVERKLMLDHLAKTKDPRCEPVKQALDQGMPSGWNTCDRISMDRGNPLLNLIYGFGYQKFLRANIQAYVTENPMSRKVFGKMAPEIKDYIESQLGMWSHNVGPGGMKRAVQSYLSTRDSRPILTIQEADKMFIEIKRFIRATDRDVNEPIRFLKAIADKKKQIESSVGVGTCAVNSK